MQSAILQKAEQLLRERKYNINVSKFIEFLTKVKSNWIYIDALERYTKDNIVDLYIVLEFLSDEGIMKRYMQMYCPNCNKYVGNCYETIQEIPSEVYCPHCDYEIIDIKKNLFLIYKVVGG